MNIRYERIEDAARTASEKGWLHELMLVEGATRAPIIESVRVAAHRMKE